MSGSATSSITAVSPSAMAASAGAVDKCVDTLIKLKSTDTCYNGQNYYTWASTISDTLESYGLAEVLTDDTHPHGKRLKAAIAMCVGAAYHDEARKCANAKELWDYFETSNKKEAGIRKLQLHAELLDLKRVPNEPLAEYLARAFKLKSSVAAAGVNISDDDMSLYLLRGLGDDEHFALVKGLYTIDVSDKSKPAPSLATLVAQLQAFDINFGKKPSTSRSGSNPATALIAPSGSFRPKFNGGGSSRPATNGYKLKPFMRQQSPTLPGTSKPGVVC